MKNHLLIRSGLAVGALLWTISACCQAPYKSALEGEMEKHGLFTHGSCKLYSLTAKYRLSTSVGQPIVYFNIKWQAGRNVAPDCMRSEFVGFWLKIYSDYGQAYFYIPVNGAMGTIPLGNDTWGNNPLAGSPNWGKLMMADPPTRNPNKNNQWNFVPEERAKTIWKWGFRVVDAIVVDRQDQQYYISNSF